MGRGAPKGHKKWGGRAKGTPNKKTEAVLNYCLSKGYDPIDAMLELAYHDDISIKLSARRDLLSYCYPKLRSIDHSLSDDSGVAEKLKAARERQERLSGGK